MNKEALEVDQTVVINGKAYSVCDSGDLHDLESTRLDPGEIYTIAGEEGSQYLCEGDKLTHVDKSVACILCYSSCVADEENELDTNSVRVTFGELSSNERNILNALLGDVVSENWHIVDDADLNVLKAYCATNPRIHLICEDI